MINIYTDGSCLGNPGPGGWGYVIKTTEDDSLFLDMQGSGFSSQTTNNRMELTALISALEALQEITPVKNLNVTVTSDSRYVLDGIQKGWAKNWRIRNWIKSDGKKALNDDLWGTLLDLTEQYKIKYIWIRGHNGHPENEICDSLARGAAERQRPL